MKFFVSGILFFFIVPFAVQAQSVKIVESNSEYIKFRINFDGVYNLKDTLISNQLYTLITGEGAELREYGQPWIPEYNMNLSIPHTSNPSLRMERLDQISRGNKNILPVPAEDPKIMEITNFDFNRDIYNNNENFPLNAVSPVDDYLFRYARILKVSIAPFQYNPVTRELVYNKEIIVQINYNSRNSFDARFIPVKDVHTEEYLKANVINNEMAGSWIMKPENSGNNISSFDGYWYNPLKEWLKIFISEKGVYRLTFDQLASSGLPLGSGVPSGKLEMFCDGEPVPIDVTDNGDGTFNQGDYLQFAGFPPKPLPYNTINIYNRKNVYWLSAQSDSSGLNYQSKDSYPTAYTHSFITTQETYRREDDLIYERLGYAPNDQRDYWFWGKATALYGQSTFAFQDIFNTFKNYNVDSHYVNLKIGLHGIQNYASCYPEHNAYVLLTDQLIGNIQWDGQTEAVFDRDFYVSEDSIKIYPQGNILKVEVRGDICPNDSSDDIRINWYEFKYWKLNKSDDNNISLVSPPPLDGVFRYWIYNWQRDNIKIYVPDDNTVLVNAQIVNDEYKSVLFIDTVKEEKNYFCVSNDYYLNPDSIAKDVPSDLRNTGNSADYIIISHKDFAPVAEELKALRLSNFPDTSITNPRISIVYVDEIYDEFSYGLLAPSALNSFVKYAFENWTSPAPFYLVLLGDMSYDYRSVLPTSRPNFIPSIPYHTSQYGQAASDNLIATVAGNDLVPDLAIGRLSIETVAEGNILLDKLRTYPADNGKPWKQNVLLLSSGLNEDDENYFGFNNASVKLENLYLIPNGIKATKIMRYPNQPQYIPFQGSGPEIRKGISEGAVLVNYYGHGGGYQWDLTFINDDIYLLENDGRLPFISSVTCYTAHFDNQDVFGEQFLKVPGKGAIAFFGSSGLTLWGIGNYINEQLFDEIFNERNYVTGKAIINAKARVGSSGFYNSQIALLTLLGDPVLELAIPKQPDFVVEQNNISVDPENPLAKDTAVVSIGIKNLGVVFPGDSASVLLEAVSDDTTYVLTEHKVGSFGEDYTFGVNWLPQTGGLYNLNLGINVTGSVPEPDLSDNQTSTSVAVFDLSDPSIVEPIDGFTSVSGITNLLLVDIGYYIDQNFTYYFEIDSSSTFEAPLIRSDGILPEEALVRWIPPELAEGVYFWRVRIFNGVDYSPFSDARSFTVSPVEKNGYYAHSQILKQFDTYNVIYSPEEKALILNTDPLPSKPGNKTLIEDIPLEGTVYDTIGMTSITTDGTYMYFTNLWYHALSHDSLGYSRIYKIGTGNNATIKGAYYGQLGEFYGKVYNSIVYFNGHIYIATGDPYNLTSVSTVNGEISSANIPAGMLSSETGKVEEGPYYLSSDGTYIYNLTFKDSSGGNKYVLRTINPSDWTLAKDDQTLSGSSYYEGFTGFFVAHGYLYPTENYQSNFMRRINLTTGVFEEEWIIFDPFQGYYAWCFDWEHNAVYASVFRSGRLPKLSKFLGSYIDAVGNINTSTIGPASKWNSISYVIDNQTVAGSFEVDLLGLNKVTRAYDTLSHNIPPVLAIDTISTDKYQYLRASVEFVDSSTTGTNRLKLTEISVDYLTLPEVIFTKSNFIASPDTMLQGFDITMDFKARNIGNVKAENLKVDFFMDDEDSLFYTQTISIDPDSSAPIQTQVISSVPLSPATLHKIKAVGVLGASEYFTFNNILREEFYVARDSINPEFNITIDGKEIINGDVVSSNPDIIITLKDSEPLQLDTNMITVVYNNIPLNFTRPDVEISETSYPENTLRIRWNPVLPDGRHVIEVLGKDPSGNFFDSVAHRTIFYIFNEFDLVEVYNYPNPFSGETYFTFQLYGDNSKLEEFKIKIYSVAGRLIRDFNIPLSELRSGFNKIFWDGRDEDGDEVANGVYFYKVITRSDGEVKTKIQKLAKVK